MNEMFKCNPCAILTSQVTDEQRRKTLFAIQYIQSTFVLTKISAHFHNVTTVITNDLRTVLARTNQTNQTNLSKLKPKRTNKMMMEKPKPSGSESPIVQQGGTATDDREAEIARRLAALGDAEVTPIEEKEEEEEAAAPEEEEVEVEEEMEVNKEVEPEEMAAPEKPAAIPDPSVPAPVPAPVPVMEQAKKPDPVPVAASTAPNNKSALLVSHFVFSQSLLSDH